jgi:putative oxidoreductase
MNVLHPVSRFLLAFIFLLSGFHKLIDFAGTATFVGHIGFPAPQLFTALAILFELGGGLALLLGWKARWAAAALMIFIVIATLTVHVPMMKDAAKAQDQMVQVLKNLAILGGLLKFFLDGAGSYAVDRAA